MRQLSWIAKAYLGFWYAAGAITLGYVVLQQRPGGKAELPLLLAASGYFCSRKIRLAPFPRGAGGKERVAQLSIGSMVTLATLFMLGPGAAVIVDAFGTLCESFYPARKRWYVAAFNISSLAAITFVAGKLYVAMHGNVGPDWSKVALTSLSGLNAWAMLAAVLTYFVLNTFSVAFIVGLANGRGALATWLENSSWSLSIFVAAGSLAAGFALLYQQYRPLSVLLLPIVVVVLKAYDFYEARLEEQAERQRESESHIAELEGRRKELQDLLTSAVECFATAIDAKDRYARPHLNRVRSYAVAIAKKLGYTDEAFLEGLRHAAALHDIGKLGVPETVLNKAGPFNAEERIRMNRHTIIGAEILAPINFPWPVIPIVRSHHEWWNGQGYPDGLAGEEIPLGARILTVVDVFDALSSDRPYRTALSREEAAAFIRSRAGTQFDPRVVDAFMELLSDPAFVHQVESEQDRYSLHVDSTTGGEPLSPGTEGHPLPPADRRSSVLESIRQANQEMIALYEVAQSMGSTLNLDATYRILLGKVEKTLGFTSAAIYMVDDRSHNLTAVASAGTHQLALAGATLRTDAGPVSQCVRSGQPALGARATEGFRDPSMAVQLQDLQSVMVAPVVLGGQVQGAIALYHVQSGFYTEDHLQVLTMVANHASMVIQNAKQYEYTRELAMADPLTGLANPRRLFSQLEQEIAQAAANGKPLNVLFIDVDGFKSVNDTCGHSRGDEVLRDIAAIIRSHVRETDLVARYAGDEFVVVFCGASHARARDAANHIQLDVRAYSQLHGLDHSFGVSFGIASFPDDGSDVRSLIEVADNRMYANKYDRKSLRLPDAVPEPTQRILLD